MATASPVAPRERVAAAIHAHMAAVEAMLRFLDRADGNPDEEDGGDLEDGGDHEPSLGSIGGCGWSSDNQETWAAGRPGSRFFVDLEQDVADEPHDEVEEGNTEPSLAHGLDLNQEQATRNITGQRYAPASKTVWHGQDQDLEVEHDGREPSLGALNANSLCQLGWGCTGTDDRD